jgi:Flp pilus assembly protein TadD
MNASRLILPAMLVVLAGCTTIQDDVKNNREATVAGCIQRVELSAARFKEHAMAYMGVSRERLPGVLCNRLADGVASGRINQSDLDGLIRTGQLTAKFKFLKG